MAWHAAAASSGTASRIFIATSFTELDRPATPISSAADVGVLPMYRIREVDGHEDEIVDTLTDLHRLTTLWRSCHSGIRSGALVARPSRGHSGRLRRRGALDARAQRGISLPGRSVDETLR